jgi:WD40 repeat protein
MDEYEATLEPAFVGDPGSWRDDGSAGPDLALVTITDEKWSVDMPRLGLGRLDRDHRAGLVDRVRAIGYPGFSDKKLASDKDPGTVRIQVPCTGQILLSHREDGLLDVQVTISPPRPAGTAKEFSQWAGMSGAPVLAAGWLVGVVSEHAPRMGDSSVAMVPVTALEPDPDHPLWGRGVAAPAAWWQRLGVRGLNDLEGLPRVNEAPYRATLREIGNALHARMPQLLGRENELDEIAAFATGHESYRWLVAGAFSGKSALVYEAVTAGLPDDVDTVCYFLSQTSPGADGAHFYTAVIPQLALLLEEPEYPADDPFRFLNLWERAADQARRRGRHLLLAVDGLDEDPHTPVAPLLPRTAMPNAHVLVTSRREAEGAIRATLDGVTPGPPLAECQTEPLDRFPDADAMENRARAEIRNLVNGGPLDREILGLLTAGGGMLTIRDLTELHHRGEHPVGDDWDIKVVLREKAARSFEAVGPGDSARYRFAHTSLLKQALAHEALKRPQYRQRIHDWADTLRHEGWPDPQPGGGGTPRYFLDTYPATLNDDPQRLAALTSDIAWIGTSVRALGVDHTIATLTEAAKGTGDPAIADLLALLAAQAPSLRPPHPVHLPGQLLRHLSLQAMQYGMDDLADRIRAHQEALTEPGPVPIWTTIRTTRPVFELGFHRGVRALAVVDGQRIVSGGQDGLVVEWDLARPGEPVVLTSYGSPITILAVFADGRVVSGLADGRVCVWEPGSAGDPHELYRHDDTVSALALLRDGRVVSGGDDEQLVVSDPSSESHTTLGRHFVTVASVVALGAGTVVSGGGGDDERLYLWDVNARKVRAWSGIGGGTVSIAALPNAAVVVAGLSGNLMLWKPGESISDLGRHAGGVHSVTALPDGSIVSGGRDGRVLLWRTDAPGQPRLLGEHPVDVLSVAALSDRRVVSAGVDGSLKVWDLLHAGAPEPSQSGGAWGLHILSDGRIISRDSQGQGLSVWQPGASTNPTRFALNAFVRSTVVVPGGRILAACESDRLVLLDPDSPNEVVEVGKHGDPVLGLAVLQDGRVVSHDNNGTLRLWNPDRIGEMTELNTPGTLGASFVAPLRDGRVVVSTFGDQLWLLDPTAPGNSTRMRGEFSSVSSLIELRSKRIVTGHSDGSLLLWDLTSRRILVKLGCLDKSIHSKIMPNRTIIFNHDVQFIGGLPDDRVVSGGFDGRVIVWDPNKPGSGVELGRHDEPIHSMAVLSNGRIVTGAYDDIIKVWDPEASPDKMMTEIAFPGKELVASPHDLPEVYVASGGPNGLALWRFR